MRNIIRLTAQWQYNDAVAYAAGNWLDAPLNTPDSALTMAMGRPENQMDAAAFTAHNNAADWPSPTNSLDGAVLMRSPDPLVTPGVAGLSLNYTTEAFLVGDSSNCQIRMSP
ncbi:MAG: hypothetical protein GY862_03355 [Gammaproteobacteria bacterium]|nr:hypothetical protein [Gammaproteobacteria bacterium]